MVRVSISPAAWLALPLVALPLFALLLVTFLIWMVQMADDPAEVGAAAEESEG